MADARTSAVRRVRPARHRPRARLPASITRLIVIFGLLGTWELLSRRGLIDPFTAPRPTKIFEELITISRGSEMYSHLYRTASTALISFVLAVALGIPIGVLLWRIRVLGDALEPYLLTLRAVPTVVFYPILLAILGLNVGPIIAVASVMAIVPVIIFTLVALRTVNPTLLKLAASFSMSPSQRWRIVIIPAATPLALPGVKQGMIYALLATVSMEFILADRGLGFRVALANSRFEVVTMYAYIFIVIVISVAAHSAISALERKVRRDLL